MYCTMYIVQYLYITDVINIIGYRLCTMHYAVYGTVYSTYGALYST